MRTLDERHQIIRDRVENWAKQLNVQPRLVRVQHMKRKWGSCSTSGTITLATDLVDQDSRFQNFVIVHELLHLRISNHSKLFKAMMTIHVPDWKQHDIKRCHD